MITVIFMDINVNYHRHVLTGFANLCIFWFANICILYLLIIIFYFLFVLQFSYICDGFEFLSSIFFFFKETMARIFSYISQILFFGFFFLVRRFWARICSSYKLQISALNLIKVCIQNLESVDCILRSAKKILLKNHI